MSRYLKPLLLVICLAYPGAAFAWGQDGHRLICALAEKELTPEGRKFVESVSSWGRYLDGETPSFPEACLWPDSVKYSDFQGSYETHFINIPEAAEAMDLTRDCGALDCILAGLQRSLVYLSRPAEGDREKGRKAAALRFLGHLVGDLHQPLHVSHGEDWGGNRIKVKWFGDETNLHRVWDHHILQDAGLNDRQGIASLEALDPEPGTVDIIAWMDETFLLARNKAYKGPNGREITTGNELGKDYLDHASPVVIKQLAKGGTRLAVLLNRLAIGQAEPIFMELSPRGSP